MSAELHSYLILIVIGFLPSEVWRWLGIALGRGLDRHGIFHVSMILSENRCPLFEIML